MKCVCIFVPYDCAFSLRELASGFPRNLGIKGADWALLAALIRPSSGRFGGEAFVLLFLGGDRLRPIETPQGPQLPVTQLAGPGLVV